jgi:hypothetical protein
MSKYKAQEKVHPSVFKSGRHQNTDSTSSLRTLFSCLKIIIIMYLNKVTKLASIHREDRERNEKEEILKN